MFFNPADKCTDGDDSTCNNQGTCASGVCTCTGTGFSGDDCTTFACTDGDASTCNNQGTCASGVCTCNAGSAPNCV